MLLSDEERFNAAAAEICPELRGELLALPKDVRARAQEIRLRAGKPVAVSCPEGALFLLGGGRISRSCGNRALTASAENVADTFRILCESSVYAHENEIRRGYVTAEGGCRAGVCGTAVLRCGEIAGLRDISSVNLRVAREKPGCADELFAALGGEPDGGLLLCGPPASGKTTILRDAARQLSNGLRGPARRVTIVDERGEIAGCRNGRPVNDVGMCTDVLDGCPKADGILMALRTLSPEVIVCDELGGEAETRAVEESLNAGAVLIASIHAGSFGELLHRRQAVSLLETGAFRNAALLRGSAEPGKICEICGAGDLLDKIRGCAVPRRLRVPCGVRGIA